MMAFKQDLVCVIVVNGEILREINGEVYLPPNTEYGIRLKNYSSRSAVVTIHIDGRYLGSDVIIEPNTTSTLERFDINSDTGRRFMFIRKNEEVTKYHGNHIDDGIIKIEYRFEKDIRDYGYSNPVWLEPLYREPYKPTFENTCESTSSVYSSSICRDRRNVVSNCQTEDGITVEGSKSNQQFIEGFVEELEHTSHIITFRLRCKNTQDIEKPITVSQKTKCKGCGMSVPYTNHYCSNCGTKVVF